MEDLSKITSALSELRKVNYKRYNKYEVAIRRSTGDEMKTLFGTLARQSQIFNKELERWLSPYKTPSNGLEHKPSVWERVSVVLSAYPVGRMSIGDFEDLEEEALRTYKAVMANSFIPSTALHDIKRQAEAIEKARKTLHDINHQARDVVMIS